jgi:hypothetical protein
VDWQSTTAQKCIAIAALLLKMVQAMLGVVLRSELTTEGSSHMQQATRQYIARQYIARQYIARQYIARQYIARQYIT